MRNCIPVLIGPFPGPVNGVSVINAKLEALLKSRGVPCERINLAPLVPQKGLIYILTRTLRAGSGFLRIIFAGSVPMRSYEISVDGDLGLIYTTLLAAAVRLRGAPLLLYHHSTRYIFANSTLVRLLLYVSGKNAAHICCSRRMFDLFRERFGVLNNVCVLSNAAWIDPVAPKQTPADSNSVRLGYLSWLSEEKGLMRAIETLREARRLNIRAQLFVAGVNATPDAAGAIGRATREFGDNFVFLGGLYDQEKWDFFSSIDYFLFPSLYPHETQSTVAPEALAAGVPVIAFDHRFVGEIVGEEGGLLIDPSEDYANAAVSWICESLDVRIRLKRRSSAKQRYQWLRAEAAGQIERLVTCLLLGKVGL